MISMAGCEPRHRSPTLGTSSGGHTQPLQPGLGQGGGCFSGCSIVLQDLNKHPAWGTPAKGMLPSQCLESSRKPLSSLLLADLWKTPPLLAVSSACTSTTGPLRMERVGHKTVLQLLCMASSESVKISHLLQSLNPAHVWVCLRSTLVYPFNMTNIQ